MKVILATLSCAALLAVPATSVAQPAPEDLAAATALQLPSWWEVAAVDVQAEVNDGDEIEPRYRQRIVVDVAAREALFLHVERVAPFTVVAPSHLDAHRLYGIASSSLERGEWKVALEFENLRDLEAAIPMTAFPPPVLVSGSDAAQRALDGFMDAQEMVRALAERSAANAASAEIIAELDKAAAERLETMKARMEAALEEIDSGVDAMIAANEATIEKLASLAERRIAAATAHADTLMAIQETGEEIAAQEELSTALEELAEKVRQNAELEAAAVEAALAVDKELQDGLRARLVSEDLSERMAAFRRAVAQQDAHLRRIALDAAFASGVDELQGAALAEVIASLPHLTVTVTAEDGAYYQTIKMTEADGTSFSGEMTTGSWTSVLAVSGTVQGDALRVHAENKNRGTVCRWDAAVDDSGILSGESMCRWNGNEHRGSPDGIASVSF